MAQVTRPTRRARSANHVSHVMEDKLDRALVAGTQPTTDGRNMRVRISLGPRKQVVLILNPKMAPLYMTIRKNE